MFPMVLLAIEHSLHSLSYSNLNFTMTKFNQYFQSSLVFPFGTFPQDYFTHPVYSIIYSNTQLCIVI